MTATHAYTFRMANTLDVYLLAGQSNMTGRGAANLAPEPMRAPRADALMYFAPLNAPDHERFARQHAFIWSPLAPNTGRFHDAFGPELAFAHNIIDARDDSPLPRPTAFIKSDLGATGLWNNWRPADTDPSTLTNGMIQHATNALAALRAALHSDDTLKECTPRIAGFVWYQGERDTRPDNPAPDAYGDLLNTLTKRVADELNNGKDFPKAFFRVHPHDGQTPNADIIRAQIMSAADKDRAAEWIDVDDLIYPDNLHLDGPSLITAGQRAAAAIIRRRDNI